MSQHEILVIMTTAITLGIGAIAVYAVRPSLTWADMRRSVGAKH